MSQIASFYLIKNNQRQELSDGDCSGAVYMAIWDWCESELDLDVRFPAPQTEDTLDCRKGLPHRLDTGRRHDPKQVSISLSDLDLHFDTRRKLQFHQSVDGLGSR